MVRYRVYHKKHKFESITVNAPTRSKAITEARKRPYFSRARYKEYGTRKLPTLKR